MAKQLKKNLSGLSLFSGSALMMAFSLLSVIVLLVWWHQLLSRNLETQYRFFKSQIGAAEEISSEVRTYIREQDERLASELFAPNAPPQSAKAMAERIDRRLANRKKMVLYEQVFFIFLLLSGHIFFLYIYFRERAKRKQTEETVLLAAHELRQPLQSLSLALDTLAPSARGKAAIAIKTGATDIEKLGQHVKWLTQSFTDKSAGEGKTYASNLGEFLKALLRTEFGVHESKRIKLKASGEPATLKIPQPLLVFLLRNLTENALKYATGDVQLNVSRLRSKVSFELANSHANLETREFGKIGTLFFRSADQKVQNTSGFGLGLYLCGRVARRCGGSLIVTASHNQMIATLKLKAS